jgi:hypothetical protein
MEHWFDEFSKRLATAPGTRRHFLQLGVTGGILASCAGILRIPMALAQTPSRTPPLQHEPIARTGAVPATKGKPARRAGPRTPFSETIGPFTINRDAQQSSFNYAGQVSVDNTPLRITLQTQQRLARASVSAVPTLESTVVIELTYGSQSVMRTLHSSRPTAIVRDTPVEGTIQISCGSMVTGLTEADLTSQRGMLSGTVNGKTIAPVAIVPNLDFGSLRYPDGSAVPVPEFDVRLQSALPQLKAKAQSEIGNFSSGGVARNPLEVPGASFQNTVFGAQTPSCLGCVDTCNHIFDICLAVSVLTLGAGTGACISAQYGCVATCFIPGNGCCKTPCHPLSCCDSNEQCCGSDVCCGPTNVEVCGNAAQGACCEADAPVGCGDETGVICCAPNSTCCATGTCCSAGNVCMPGGTCCPSNAVCNGSCCPTGQTCLTAPGGAKVCCDPAKLCGTVCCDGQGATCVNGRCGVGQPCGNTFCGFENCCGGTCCATSCINGRCCPTQNTCGSICCPAGQVCSTGHCVSTCPNGMDFSWAPDGTATCCPLYQCLNPSNDNVCVEASCAGVCCGQKQVCCRSSGGQYSCMNPPCPTLAQ